MSRHFRTEFARIQLAISEKFEAGEWCWRCLQGNQCHKSQ